MVARSSSIHSRSHACCATRAAAGLLHHVSEHAHVDATELTARFGPAVTNLVRAVTDQTCTSSYRQRNQILREQIRRAGSDATLLFAADTISNVRELPDLIRRDQARLYETPRESRARHHLQHYQQMRLEHYQQGLVMLQRIADPRNPLVQQLANVLDCFPVAIGEQGAAARQLD